MITVDFNKITGRVKPLHGVNNSARLSGYGPLLPDFAGLRVPFSRLHDTQYPYGGGHYVDIPCVFPDFSADPDDPASYDFTLTDLYIGELVKNGTQVMYRLGVSIEHAPRKYNIFPPADPVKWADVAEHIVRHYNRGWADGHHWNIRYWEIWNEPDGDNPDCEPFGRPMWEGTARQYYELYSVTANRIKAMHPDVLVGGYSSCYIMGSFHSDEMRWIRDDAAFFRGFLEYITAPATRAPLDFFSWHGYQGDNDTKKIVEESEFVDRMLAEYSLGGALRFNTEWNILARTGEGDTSAFVNMRNEIGASNMAATMFAMQRCRIDGAMFYDAPLYCSYGPLFELPSLRPTKAYEAFRLFGELYALGDAAEATQEDGISVLAATDGVRRVIAIACTRPVSTDVDIEIIGEDPASYTLTYPICGAQTGIRRGSARVSMPPHSVAVLRRG